MPKTVREVLTEAQIEDLTAAGFAVVPVEPTEKMLEEIWPYVLEGKKFWKLLLEAARNER